jgi:hypothetical protein
VSKRAQGRAEVIRLLKKSSSGGQQTVQQLQFATDYLTFFGYLSVELLSNLSVKDIENAVKVFQKAFGISADGVLDTKTRRAMEMPRCGCPDILDRHNKKHTQFLRAQEVSAERRDRWNKTGLTYHIRDYVTSRLPRKTQAKIIAGAFKAWDDVCGLNIMSIKEATKADIIVSTGQGPAHNFDGAGGTLAWAFLPTGTDKQLTMRFDLDETWIDSTHERGVLMSHVACHEFGHLLGLNHSKKAGALMAPYYNPYVGTPQMADDIERIQKLYGKHEFGDPVTGTLKQEEQRIELKPGQRVLVVCN